MKRFALDLKKTRRRPQQLEEEMQKACTRWFDYAFPNLRLLLHHSPNEGLLPKTARDGAKRKAMGVRAGFPDLIFLLPRKGYAFFAIELKTKDGRQSERQKAYEEAVCAAGGKYEIVRSLDDFMQAITDYLK